MQQRRSNVIVHAKSVSFSLRFGVVTQILLRAASELLGILQAGGTANHARQNYFTALSHPQTCARHCWCVAVCYSASCSYMTNKQAHIDIYDKQASTYRHETAISPNCVSTLAPWGKKEQRNRRKGTTAFACTLPAHNVNPHVISYYRCRA